MLASTFKVLTWGAKSEDFSFVFLIIRLLSVCFLPSIAYYAFSNHRRQQVFQTAKMIT